ncbi:MAG: DNA-formamidopyrimidine glycosylase [Candidatus Paceibacterota bacterium]
MPELPEVQTVVNGLNKKIVGRKITGVWFDSPKIIKKLKSADFEKQIKGLKIEKVSRRGKNILIYLTTNNKLQTQKYLLLIHQKMTGHLMIGKWKIHKVSSSRFRVSSIVGGPLAEKVNGYIHLIFYLDNGWQLALSDLRKFAKVLFGKKEDIEKLPDLAELGPEPLDKSFNFGKFLELIRPERRKIKQVLMDQKVIVGIGNIYADEILYAAKIHPVKPADKLKDGEIKRIYLAMKKILKKAISLRGTSTSDFRDISGVAGKYGKKLLVYRKEGEKCPSRCGGLVKRVKMGGRSAHFCPKCQKL